MWPSGAKITEATPSARRGVWMRPSEDDSFSQKASLHLNSAESTVTRKNSPPG